MLQLTNPQPFQEALDSRAVKSVLPTTLRTREMSALPAEIRERAFWSAGVTSTRFLDEANSVIEDILAGKIDRATGRQRLDALREELGAPSVAEVGKGGGLTDLWSERRQNVLIDTNVRMARGYGQYAQGMDPDVLDEFPASEFLRVAPRLRHRDDSKDTTKHWDYRWERACMSAGDLLALRVFKKTGRMIALKTSDVWIRLSRFGLPYDPVDYNTGMGRRDVDRDEAEKLELIKPEQTLTPKTRGFNDDFQLSPDVRSATLLNVLVETFKGMGLNFTDGIFSAS